MKVYKIELGKYTKRDKWEAQSIMFCTSNLSLNDVRSIYTNKYSMLTVAVDEVKEIEDLTVGGIIEDHSGYTSYPTHYFTTESLPEADQKLVSEYIAHKDAMETIKAQLKESFKTLVKFPDVTQITKDTVSVKGNFKQDLFSRIKPVETEEDNG